LAEGGQGGITVVSLETVWWRAGGRHGVACGEKSRKGGEQKVERQNGRFIGNGALEGGQGVKAIVSLETKLGGTEGTRGIGEGGVLHAENARIKGGGVGL
jgi:hypothetical protein